MKKLWHLVILKLKNENFNAIKVYTNGWRDYNVWWYWNWKTEILS